MSELKRMPPNERRQKIVEGALYLMGREGTRISRSYLAEKLKVSAGLIAYHFGDMQGLIDAVMREAIAREELTVIAHGLVEDNLIARGAPSDLKEKAALSIV